MPLLAQAIHHSNHLQSMLSNFHLGKKTNVCCYIFTFISVNCGAGRLLLVTALGNYVQVRASYRCTTLLSVTAWCQITFFNCKEISAEINFYSNSARNPCGFFTGRKSSGCTWDDKVYYSTEKVWKCVNSVISVWFLEMCSKRFTMGPECTV